MAASDHTLASGPGTLDVAEQVLRVMGGKAQVIVVGGPCVGGGASGLAHRAMARLHALEARWSRFRADSELSRLNDCPPGVPVIVSADTFELIDKAIAAWRATAGAFDPTVLDALEGLGYDRTFGDLFLYPGGRPAGEPHGGAGARGAPGAPGRPSPGCADIGMDPGLRAVARPDGVRLDPGGIGKGLAADIVVAELLDAGAAGALVNLNGDVRVDGEPPSPAGWVVGVEDPLVAGRLVARFRLDGGGVATSSTRLRRWRVGERELHHLVDPATGAPVGEGLASATAVATTGWWAEAMTKAMMVAGPGRALSALIAASGIAVGADGSVDASGDLLACLEGRDPVGLR